MLHIFSPAQKSTYETKRKNYAQLLRSKLKIQTLSTIVTPPLNTATNLFNEPDRNGHSALLTDKTYSPRLAWSLSQAITWFATDRNVQWKKSSMPTIVSSGGTVKWSNSVKKFTLQLRYNKLFSLLCCRLFEGSPAWFCSHLLAMIQACTYYSAIFVKSQQ